MEIKRIKKFLVINSLLITYCINAQSQTIFQRDGYCSYIGENNPKNNLKVDEANSESIDVVDLILRFTGIKKNFTINESKDVPNAEASIKGEKRYVIFNQNFLDLLSESANNNWATASIMAHELGHHLQGHTLGSGGSSPILELEADKYSGFILQKMGASLEDAISAIRTVASEKGSMTHPGKATRISAITNGWREAEALSIPSEHNKKPDKEHFIVKEFGDNTTVDGKKVKRSFAAFEDPKQNNAKYEDELSYVARFVFDADEENDSNPIEAEYYLIDSNEIVGFNDYGSPVIIGKVVDSDNDQFVYKFYLNNKTFYVDDMGEIIELLENGDEIDLGYVTDVD